MLKCEILIHLPYPTNNPEGKGKMAILEKMENFFESVKL